MRKFISLLLVTSLFVVEVRNQYFDPKLDDKTYLDTIQSTINTEVKETKAEFLEQAKITDDAARRFVGAQIKENLFIALRVLAERELRELETLKEQQKVPIKKPKQDETGEEDEDEDSTSASAGGSTTARTNNIIPQVANLVKAVFGGTGNINLTSYVEAATKLLPRPVGNQVLGLVKLLSYNSQATTTKKTLVTKAATTTTPAPFIPTNPPVIQLNLPLEVIPETVTLSEPIPINNFNLIESTLVGVPIPISNNSIAIDNNLLVNANAVPVLIPAQPALEPLVPQNLPVLQQPQLPQRIEVSTLVPLPSPRPTDEDDDDDEEDPQSRQLGGVSAVDGLNFLGVLIGGRNRSPTNRPRPRPTNAIQGNAETGSNSTITDAESVTRNPEDEFDLRGVAESIRNGLGDLVKIMPDVFKGAREGFRFMQSISSVFGGIGGLGGD